MFESSAAVDLEQASAQGELNHDEHDQQRHAAVGVGDRRGDQQTDEHARDRDGEYGEQDLKVPGRDHQGFVGGGAAEESEEGERGGLCRRSRTSRAWSVTCL